MQAVSGFGKNDGARVFYEIFANLLAAMSWKTVHEKNVVFGQVQECRVNW